MADPIVTPGSGSGGGVTGSDGSPPGGGAPPAAWHAGAEAEVMGHWQTQGWDLTNPLTVATAATKVARDYAAQFGGAAPNEIIRMPKAGDEAGARAMWQRLGVPPDVNGYDLSAIKFADGTDLDEGFVSSFRAAAHKLNIPKDQAVGLAQEVVRYMEGAEAAETAASVAKNLEESTALRTNWGKNWDVNMHVAKQAALKLGFTEDQINGLQKTVGYARTMETFRNLGMSQGEGRFLEGGANGGGVFTKEQAVAKKAELMKDTPWVQKYLSGDSAAKNEMTQLNTIIVGEDDTARFMSY
jgi:hypothetical protein